MSRMQVLLRVMASCLLLLASTSIRADEYRVQIGAFRSPEASFAAAAESVGPVHHSKTAEGVVRIQVGRYATEEEASAARAMLLDAGYTGAFVVRTDRDAAPAVPSAPSVPSTPSDPSTPKSDPLAGVPLALRDRVVILDGRIHVVEGDDLIPLDLYLRSQD